MELTIVLAVIVVFLAYRIERLKSSNKELHNKIEISERILSNKISDIEYKLSSIEREAEVSGEEIKEIKKEQKYLSDYLDGQQRAITSICMDLDKEKEN